MPRAVTARCRTHFPGPAKGTRPQPLASSSSTARQSASKTVPGFAGGCRRLRPGTNPTPRSCLAMTADSTTAPQENPLWGRAILSCSCQASRMWLIMWMCSWLRLLHMRGDGRHDVVWPAYRPRGDGHFPRNVVRVLSKLRIPPGLLWRARDQMLAAAWSDSGFRFGVERNRKDDP